jgi:excisionase family DNA binding protein
MKDEPAAAFQAPASIVTPATNPAATSPIAVKLPEAGAMVGVSAATIRREIDRGNLRGFRIGRQWRVRVNELHAYLQRQERKLQT